MINICWYPSTSFIISVYSIGYRLKSKSKCLYSFTSLIYMEKVKIWKEKHVQLFYGQTFEQQQNNIRKGSFCSIRFEWIHNFSYIEFHQSIPNILEIVKIYCWMCNGRNTDHLVTLHKKKPQFVLWIPSNVACMHNYFESMPVQARLSISLSYPPEMLPVFGLT